MGFFGKKKEEKIERQLSNPLLAEQAIARRNPAKKVIEGGPEAAREAQWQPPLQRHIRPDDGSEFVTIRVRILNGDAEHDFNSKFPAGPLLGQRVCEIIADREGLSQEARRMFALWIVAKDLELQVRPDLDIFSIMNKWNTLVLDYTHYPEAVDPSHPINRHWFVYRREATVTQDFERKFTDDATVRLLYGEAKRNVMTGRYVCTLSDAVALGGMMLTLQAGSYDRMRHPEGYLMNNDTWKTLIPLRLHDDLKPQEWEDCLRNEHAKHIGRSVQTLRIMYLEFVREWACYGCSFFPCCKERPPAGFFEFRLQRWLLGVSTSGVVVIDIDKNGYAFAQQWNNVTIKRSPDRIILRWEDEASRKQKKMKLFTPQAQMAHNLALRAKYIALKEEAQQVELAKRPPLPASTVIANNRHSVNLPGPTQGHLSPASFTPAVPRSASASGNFAAGTHSGQSGPSVPRNISYRDMRGQDMPPVYEEPVRSRQTTNSHETGQLHPARPVSYGGSQYSPAPTRTRAESANPPIAGEPRFRQGSMPQNRMISGAKNNGGAQPWTGAQLDAVDAMLASAVADLGVHLPSAPSAPPIEHIEPPQYGGKQGSTGINSGEGSLSVRPASHMPMPTQQPLPGFANSRRPSMQAFTAVSGSHNATKTGEVPRPSTTQALGAFSSASRRASLSALSSFLPPDSTTAPGGDAPSQENTSRLQPSHRHPSMQLRQPSFMIPSDTIPETSVYTTTTTRTSVITNVAAREQNNEQITMQSGTFGEVSSMRRDSNSFNYRRPSITATNPRSRSNSIISTIASALKSEGVVTRGADKAPNYAAAFETYL